MLFHSFHQNFSHPPFVHHARREFQPPKCRGLARSGHHVQQLQQQPAHGLDAQAERRDVEEDHILDLAAEHTALNRGADRDDFIGMTLLLGSLPKICLTSSWTFGIRVDPPTNTTSWI